MMKFIEVHETVINIADIRRIEFISDDIYFNLLPIGEDGQILCETIPFTFAKIYTFDGEIIELSLDLYALEDNETEDSWVKKNRAFISMTMTSIYELINPVKVTDREHAY